MGFLIIEYSAMSSVQCHQRTWQSSSAAFDAPLMYTRDKSGPITYPWGTPETTGKGLDCAPSNTTEFG